MLIDQPGSDYQLTGITLDAGRARDITCLLTDLCLNPARPKLTVLARACLRDCDSLYTPEALISALDEVTTMLTSATRDALRQIPS